MLHAIATATIAERKQREIALRTGSYSEAHIARTLAQFDATHYIVAAGREVAQRSQVVLPLAATAALTL